MVVTFTQKKYKEKMNITTSLVILTAVLCRTVCQFVSKLMHGTGLTRFSRVSVNVKQDYITDPSVGCVVLKFTRLLCHIIH